MNEPPVRYIRDWIKGGQDATLVLVTAATNAARAPRARSHARTAVGVTSRILARMAVTAGLAVVGWLLMLVFSSSASATEVSSDDGGGGLLGGVVGGLAGTTSNFADTTVKIVKSTTDTVTNTVQSTVKTVTDTVKITTDVVGDTLDNVTGTVDTVTPAVPAETQPVEAAPVETSPAPAPAVSKPAPKAVTKKASADRPKPSARALVRSDMARPDESPPRIVDLPRAVGSAPAASDGSDSTPFGSKLPSTPCGTASAAAAPADSAGKKLSGMVAGSATISHLQRSATGSVQPAAATVAAASLPCTSPD